MVTAAQLQILQSPISSLISTVSSSVTVKLDDSNYLVWNFQMELLLEGHGIMGFVDGINPCPSRFDSTVSGGSTDSSLRVETDTFKIWKMHDRALMQLITATLSPSAVSCAIGSTSARDLWVRLKEQFSIVTRTTIFQMKSALQNIKKGTDSISQYLQRIKEARDYLSAAGVTFADDDIVILTLNGLSSEYNTLRSIIRGREHVISMKDLRSQLLAEEAMIENVAATPFLTAMVAKNSGHDSQNSSYGRQSNPYGSQSGFFNASGYKPNFHKNKGRGKFYNNSYPRFGNNKSGYINNAPGILGNSPSSQQGQFPTNCQICGKYGHLADTCRFRNSDTAVVQGCQICGKKNHSAQFCLYRNSNVQNSPPTAMHVNTVSNSVVPSASPQQFWLTDSGATSHMTADLNNLSLATPYSSTETIQTASGAGLSISHIGSSHIPTPIKPLQLHYVLYDKATGRIMFKGLCSDGLYPIPFPGRASSPRSQVAFLGHQVSSALWHSRLGHPSNSVVSSILKQCQVSVAFDSNPVICSTCLEGKFCKLPFVASVSKSVTPFEVVHTDVWGPSPCISVDSFRYYVTFIDECTRYCWIFPLSNKSDVCSVFVGFYNFVLNHFTTTIKTLQSDGGGEYISKTLQTFLLDKGINHQISCPHTPEQNGLAERKHRHIIETSITLLQTASLPAQFWSFACQVAVYLINRMPTSTLNNKSPFELLFHSIPDIIHLRIFGCSCFPLLRPYNSTKLQPRTTKCIFLGYASKYKGFICYEVSHKRIYVSRHVIFDETEFPYTSLSSKCPVPVCSKSLPSFVISQFPNMYVTNQNTIVPGHTFMPNDTHFSAPNDAHSSSPQLITATPTISASSSPSLSSPTPVAPASTSQPSYEQSEDPIGFSPDSLQVVLPILPLNTHSMQTRSKSGISKKKVFLSVLQDDQLVDLSQTEPATYKSALKSSVWLSTMKEELSALHSQGTWSLVPLPPHKNLVGCKWVYKIKKNADGTISRYKARLVAKGFNQEEGVDYGETFSPVVKPTTVRLVLALAAHFGWSLRQLDVKNAFLHGILQEEVYMSQPPGFLDPHYSTHVCRLHKSLYGLKQAPRAWNERFTMFLPSLGFLTTYSDSSLFVKHVGQSVVLLLLYVDDIIITGSATDAITEVIGALHSEFDIKDLGPLHYFLGIQITQQSHGLFLSQSKYVSDLLIKTDMLQSKSCTTPCLAYNRLLKDDGKPFNNPALYRSIVGALQYLTFTRPDIAFSVHQVCQFMHCPMESHFVAVKRILRYLRGTQDYGIQFSTGDLTFYAYSDADWAGDPNDRRSTTGLVVYLGSNPISWSSKKQNTVSRSSTEAEYRALSSTVAEMDWIKQLLQFMNVSVPSPAILYCDNLSAIALAYNPVMHQRTKHIDIDVHFVRERVAKKLLQVQFVTSNAQFADILTKGLSTSLFHTHCYNLRLGNSHPEIAGGC
ncbi:hypothetical protein ACFX15_006016 [Malus domestica]